MENQVSQPIPAEALAQVQQHLTAVRALLAPYLVPLTPEQRQDLPKMGDKSVAFVQKAADYSTALAPYLPAYVDGAGLRTNARVSADLLPVYTALLGLTTDVDSTRLEAGSEGYSAALLVYAALQAAAKQNQPGTQAAVSELGERFAAQGLRKAKAKKDL